MMREPKRIPADCVAAQTGKENESIKRYYNITPSNNSGLNATFVFHFDDSKLNGKIKKNNVECRK